VQIGPPVSHGTARWVGNLFLQTTLQEGAPYWERYIQLVKIQDSHNRRAAATGTAKAGAASAAIVPPVEERLAATGERFLDYMQTEQENK